MGWEAMLFISLAISMISTISTVAIQSQQNKRAYNQQRQLMIDQAPLAMQGYEQAGINPWAAGTSPVSSSTPSAPSAPSVNPMSLFGSMPQMLQSMSSAPLNEAKTAESFISSELGKANIQLVQSKIGLTDAEAKVAVAKNFEIEQNIVYLKSLAENVRAKTQTEGYMQSQLEANTNLIGETALKTKQERENLILDGKMTAANLDYVLPSVAKKAYYDAEASKQNVDYLKLQIAELFNNVTLQSMDVDKALMTFAQDMATHKLERDAANRQAATEAMESNLKAESYKQIYDNPSAYWYLQGQMYLEILFGPSARTVGTALGGSNGTSGLAKWLFRKK